MARILIIEDEPDLVRGLALLGTRGRMTRFLETLTRNTVEELRADARTSPRNLMPRSPRPVKRY